jgi:hypothetical protein
MIIHSICSSDCIVLSSLTLYTNPCAISIRILKKKLYTSKDGDLETIPIPKAEDFETKLRFCIFKCTSVLLCIIIISKRIVYLMLVKPLIWIIVPSRLFPYHQDRLHKIVVSNWFIEMVINCLHKSFLDIASERKLGIWIQNLNIIVIN